MQDDLVAFLGARLDEDEGRATDEDYDLHLDWCKATYIDSPGLCDCGNPARVLREVAAKRAILKWHPSQRMRYIDASRCPQCELTWPCPTVRYLAAVYRGHPDYREEWKI